MRFDRDTYFRGHREVFGRLAQEQVNGLNFLLDSIEADQWENVQQVAYVLATVDHETNHTFQPIRELRERKTSPRRANQDRYWLTDYYGRGYVQITWKKNYEKFGIADEPDKALGPATAYRILSTGMRQGLFTGHKLSDYVNENETDYINARRIVNGLDKAEQIAGVARKFEAILSAAERQVVTPKLEAKEEPPVQTVPSQPPVVEVKTPSGSITSKIAAAAAAAGPVIGATGLKLGGVEFSAMSIIALCAMISIGIIVGAILWDRDRQRQLERQKLSITNLASPTLGNVVAKSE